VRVWCWALGSALAAVAALAHPAQAADARPAAACRPEASEPLPADPGRQRRCVIDVGSRNVKLIEIALRPGDPLSVASVRTCRSRMQLGEKTFDQATQMRRPLGAADLEALTRQIAEFQALCARDGGTVEGAMATEWARRATNADEIRQKVQAGAGIDLRVLDGAQEGRYGYLAATRGARGKLVLDLGSRSMQLSYWPIGAAAPEIVGLPLGIDESGDRFFGKREYADYATARAAYAGALREPLTPLLAKIRKDLRKHKLAPEIYSLAENGDVALALAGRLWDASAKGVSEEVYSAAVKATQPQQDKRRGLVTAVLSARAVAALSERLDGDRALFDELRSDGRKRFFGNKMLVLPALIRLLEQEIGLKSVVLVPQEMSEGLVIDQLAVAGGAPGGVRASRPTP
jgi:hypothetical protein